jgi:hypothetical protein
LICPLATPVAASKIKQTPASSARILTDISHPKLFVFLAASRNIVRASNTQTPTALWL